MLTCKLSHDFECGALDHQQQLEVYNTKKILPIFSQAKKMKIKKLLKCGSQIRPN